MNNIALFLHLVGVALLVASVTITLLTLMRIQTARTVRELRSLVAGTKKVEFVIIPAMLLIIASGLYMVSQHDSHGAMPWTAGWVITSLVVTLILAALGPTVEASDDKRLRAAIAGAKDERPHADLREVQLAARPTYVVFFGTSQVVALFFPDDEQAGPGGCGCRLPHRRCRIGHRSIHETPSSPESYVCSRRGLTCR